MKFKSAILLAIIGGLIPGLAIAADADFDSKGIKIHYATEGQGEAVILIHGWMSDSTMWGSDGKGNTKLSPLPGFQVVALDCRGHGKSDKPHDSAKYGAEMAEDVVRLLDHLKIKKAHLIGYSMGSFIAAKVAATHPDRVLSIIYGGQAPLIPVVHPAGSKEIDIFAKAVEDGKGLGPYIIYVSPDDKPKPTMDQANALGKFMFETKDVEAFAASGRSFKGLEVTIRDLEKCKVPTLFIYGGNESANSRANIEEVRKVVAPSEVKVVEGGTHMTTLAKPEFGKSIVDFLIRNKSKSEK